MTRPLVYIAHALSGDWDANIARARRYVDLAARSGWAPVAPYLTLLGLLHEPEDRDLGLAIDVACVVRCDEIWLCGPCVSPGMAAELLAARGAGVPERRVACLADVLWRGYL